MPSKRVKIAVHVPESHTKIILEAIYKAGAGVMGNYDYVTFITHGIGTFRQNSEANPATGNKNEINFEPEDKIEFVCEYDKAKETIEGIKAVHPHEEVAYSVVEMLDL